MFLHLDMTVSLSLSFKIIINLFSALSLSKFQSLRFAIEPNIWHITGCGAIHAIMGDLKFLQDLDLSVEFDKVWCEYLIPVMDLRKIICVCNLGKARNRLL